VPRPSPCARVVLGAGDRRDDASAGTATATDDFKLTFGAFVGVKVAPITVRSTARIMGKMRLCLLTLDPGAVGTLHLEKNANLPATACSLYADSTNAQAIQGDENAIAKAETICSAGGASTTQANFVPPVTSGCPAIKDPLAGTITVPAPGACVTVSSSAGPGPGQGPGGPAAGNIAITTNTTLNPGSRASSTKKAVEYSTRIEGAPRSKGRGAGPHLPLGAAPLPVAPLPVPLPAGAPGVLTGGPPVVPGPVPVLTVPVLIELLPPSMDFWELLFTEPGLFMLPSALPPPAAV
jgi:hypothetical protein